MHGRGLRRRIRASGRALWIERLAGCFWPLFVVASLFPAAAIFGVFQAAGPMGHRILLGAFGLAALAAAVRGVRRFRRPGGAEAMRRLEEAAPDRPLSALSDALGAGRGSPYAEALWRAHRLRAGRAALALRVRAPDVKLSAQDRWALRLLAPAALAGALLGGGGEIGRALTEAASPAPLAYAPPEIARNPTVEAWAAPPGHTGMETVRLIPGPDPVRLPEGSEIAIQTVDLEVPPQLDAPGLSGPGGFAPLGGGIAEAVAELTDSGPVRVMNGGTVLASWMIEAIPDAPPRIAFAAPPRATATQALEISFRARDDYGVVLAWAEIRPLRERRGKGLDPEPVEIALPLPIVGDARDATDAAVADLTGHVLAGSQVEIALYAEDGAGQIGRADPLRVRLPERRFGDPLAASLIEQRRNLAMDFDAAPKTLDAIQAVTARPHEIFKERYGPHMGARMAVRRLAAAVADETVAQAAPELVDLLWDVALSLEDGDLPDALERLRAAERALREALENGTDEDIRRAVEDLRRAMNEYLRELARRAERGPEGLERTPQRGPQLSRRDLEDMLDGLRRRAESGLRDEARDMLSDLSRILEDLRAGLSPQGDRAGRDELEETIRRQRDLADRTFGELRRQRRGLRPDDGDDGGGGEGDRRPGGSDLAGEQEALRRSLEDLRGLFPGGDGASRALEEAGEAMGEARDALREGENSKAVQDQLEALDRLGEGARALAERVRDGRGAVGARGRGESDGGDRGPGEVDPFHRALGSNGNDPGVGARVPDGRRLDRARELLRELRQRSAETRRPEMELDYYDRLLRKF